MKIKLTILLSSITFFAFGQTSTFKWNDFLCEYISTYNNTQYSEDQIKNCYLLTKRERFTIVNTPVFYQPKLIEKFNLDTLDSEYNYKSGLLKNLVLPQTEYWKALQNSLLIELDQLYKLTRITYLSLSDPKSLKQFKHKDYCLDKHSSALIAGGDSLLNDWYSLTLQSARQNGNSDRVWEEYNGKYSRDKFLYAKLYVTGFGWWNCAIKYIDRSAEFKNVDSEFTKLFISTKKVRCDEL